MNDAVYVNNAMANEVRRNRTRADFALLYADEGFRVLPPIIASLPPIIASLPNN